VFQDYLLFPHLDAIDNVAFGLRSRGIRRAAANRVAAELLEQVGLGEQKHAKPAELSGGQAQRVALARALAIQPRLLLLDEPLAALDVTARAAVRRDLSRHLEAFDGVRLLVTHDPLDAAALADRIVILERGMVVQTGSLADISTHPRSDYAAELVGVNLLRGTAHTDHVTLTTGADIVVPDAGTGPALVVIHPRSIAVHRTPPSGSPRNVIDGRVDAIDRFGDRVRVHITGDVPLVAEITPAALHDLALDAGAPVWAAIKATDINAYPA
jgi:molybdate transport system ATP-binding protein